MAAVVESVSSVSDSCMEISTGSQSSLATASVRYRGVRPSGNMPTRKRSGASAVTSTVVAPHLNRRPRSPWSTSSPVPSGPYSPPVSGRLSIIWLPLVRSADGLETRSHVVSARRAVGIPSPVAFYGLLVLAAPGLDGAAEQKDRGAEADD